MANSKIQEIQNRIDELRSGAYKQNNSIETQQIQSAKEEKNQGGLIGGIGYLGHKLGYGVLRSVEGITDFLVGGVADLVGADDFADNIMKNDWVNYALPEEWYNPGQGWQFAGDVAQGIGGMLPAVAVSVATGGAALPATAVFGLGAAGQSVSEAVKESGNLGGKEWLYGTASGALETGIEALSGGIGGSQVGKVLGKQLGKSALGKIGVSFVSEGLEEVASDLLDPALKRITGVDKNATVDWANLPRTFAVGGATGAVMGGLNTGLSSLKAGGVNNLRAAEAMQELTERQADNNVRQAKGKAAIYTQEDIARTKESLSKRLQKMDSTTRAQFLQANANIANQFNEDGTVKSVAPAPDTYNTNAYSASLQGREGSFAYKPIAETSNATAQAKQVMDTLTKITDGKTNIVLTEDVLTTEGGKQANGLYKDGIIYLNANATDYQKALTVGVHEVIHGLEGTKEYSQLAKAITEEINNNPELAKQYNIDKYRNAYDKLLEGEWTEGTKEYQAATEIFADFLANKVVNNEQLLRNLAVRNSNVVVRFLNWVRNAIASLGESAEDRAVRKDLKKLEGLLVNALEAGTGGISLEEVEENIKRGEELRKKKEGNVQSVKFGENKNRVTEWLNVNRLQLPLRSSIGNSTSIITEKDDLSSENAKKVEKISSGRASIDIEVDLADFPSIDKWFESLTVEDLRELIDNDYSVEDISEELNVDTKKMRYLIRREGLGNSYVEDSKKAVMKQERIDEAIDDSGASNPTYARDYITAISPKDFIDLTVTKNHVERDTFDTEVIGDHGSKMGEWDYEKALKTSRSPYLQIDKATGRIIGHNGRHRVRALEKAGIQSVEIQVEFFDEDGRLIKYDAETIPKMAISSQFDTDIETTISKIIPLNESHRAEIESTYGEKTSPKAGVRYSLPVDMETEVKKYYGNTYRWNETGYILQDGTRLDLSGRNEGASGGYRTVDHRDIFDINEDLDVYGTDAMNEFIARGNIRVMPETPGINLQVEPNAEQYRLIQDFVERVGWKEGYFSVDIDNKNGDTIETLTYEGKPSGRKVVEDLKYYFKEGKVPYKSNLSAFRYSIDVDNFDPIGYTEITLPAQERNRVQSEALKWDGTERNKLMQKTLSNGYTYWYTLDTDNEIHIYEKSQLENIHEVRSSYANKNARRFDRVIEIQRNERGLNSRDNGNNKNGRNQGTVDTSNNRKIRPEGQSDGRRYQQDGVYAERTKERKGIVYYDSEGRYSLDTELDNKTTARVQAVSDMTMAERWQKAWEALQLGKADQWIKAQIAWTDEQAGIIHAGRNLGIVMHGEVQRARVAKASAINMLNDSQRDYSGKKRVGDSLKAIFKPIQSRGEKVAQAFNLYLLHQLNVDRMSAEERGFGENKPVFEKDVDKAFSLEKIQQLEKQYPEFKKTAEKVWQYNQNLLQYRVDAGLITQAQADQMTEMYPHYVPAFYEQNGGGTSGAFVGQKGVAVKTGIKSAKGSTGVSDIKDVQASIAKQTMAVVRAASINKIVEKLHDGAVAKNDFTDIEVAGKESITNPDVDYDTEIPKENQVFFYKDGERITLNVTQYVDAGFRGLTAGAQMGDPLTTLSAKGISLFKKLVTSWNPLFAATNALRDIQEALFYTKYGKRFFANYGKALATRMANPRMKELWEQYKAMGGTGSGYFSQETGVFDNRSKLRKSIEWAGDKVQFLNEWVEQAPRFAEFVSSIEAGNSLEQALYDSAEVTTNFSRGGKVAKSLNRHLIPFLNPSIQGWSKMWRGWVAPMDGKSAAEIEKLSQQSKGRRFLSNYGALIFKTVLFGISVGLVNDMLYRWIDEDEDYENLPLNIKENYYLIKVGKNFIKIPKGRVVALYGMVATRIVDAVNGNEEALDAWDWFKSASSMVSPLESAGRTIFAPLRDVGTNTTWYGSEIENASMENLAPSERYDEGTSSIAVAMGKALNYSPKKIHYLIDQYSGFIGDIILPATTNKAEKDPLTSRFVVDPLYNNNVSTKHYDYKEELTWAKNGGDTNAKLMLKYMNGVQDKLSEMYQQKRDIANDKSLTDKQKREQTEIVQSLINATLSSSVDMADKFEQLLINSKFAQAVGVLQGNLAYKRMDDTAQKSAYNKLTEYYYEVCLAKLNGTKVSAKYTLYGAINATDIVVYLTNINNIESDKDKKGNTIQGSRKEKVQKYIDGLRLTAQQKYILSYLSGYSLTDNGKSAVSKYLRSNGYTQKEINDLWN